MKIEISKMTLKELAGFITEKLKEHGIDCILVGGACVTIYSKNKYHSYDLDFVTYEDFSKVQNVLKGNGFQKEGRYFVYKGCEYFIDFVSSPVAISRDLVKKFTSLKTPYGKIILLTAHDCVKDRLSSYFHWDDLQALDQAELVYKQNANSINLKNLEKWAKRERKEEKFHRFKENIKV
ncbi:MAG: hypothetical protein K1000chlam2_01615 [Chlamydiae bacterium]|nr:hypothetical protein [Chlamydiota bacterium]